jgi:MerR family transcriptional regulator, light-induced transcriptional regulator
MNAYHITDIERLTGIKAHTIRIWEKRYGIVDPHRTDTNIRYYDDDQLRKLLNVGTLLKNGQKISAVSKLSEKELTDEIRKQDIQTFKAAPDDVISETYISNLVMFMVGFDEDGFEKTFSSAVTRFGIYEAMLKVFYPFMDKAGILWSTADILPAQEHFAMNLIKRKLLAAIDGLRPANRHDKKFVLYLPLGEWHEISLLFADYIIRSKGYKTLYLGQSVPAENLETTIVQYKPTHVLGFYIADKRVDAIERSVNQIAENHTGLTVLVSGSAVVNATIHLAKNVMRLTSPMEFEKMLA